MLRKTTHYELLKPDYNETADIEVVNSNMDIIDGALHELKEDINNKIVIGKNKFDYKKALYDRYLNTIGQYEEGTGFATSQHIQLNSDIISISQAYASVVYVHEFVNGVWSGYKTYTDIKNKENISVSSRDIVIVTTENNRYTLQVEEGNKCTDYVPFTYTLYSNDNDINIDKIINGENLNFIGIGRNKFDKRNIVTDKFLNTAGQWQVGSGFLTSELIPLEIGKKYFVSLNGVATVYLHGFVSKDTWVDVSVFENTSVFSFVATSPYIKLVTDISVLDSLQIEQNENEPTTYTRYSFIVDKLNNYKTNGKIGYFNGDSICFGSGYTGGYPKIVSEETGLIYTNYGVSGSLLTKKEGRTDSILERLSLMGDECDYLILEGGVNDCSENIPLGTLSNGYDAELDEYTFYGAVESIVKQCLNRYVGTHIGFVLVHRQHNYGTVASLETYFDAIKEVCNKWSIPCLDLFHTSSLNTHIESYRAKYTLNGDGIHPTKEGYETFYKNPIINFMESM